MKEFKVNKDICIGCGACAAICPEVFDIDEDGLAKTIKHENLTEEEVVEATDAMEGCPTGAISEENELVKTIKHENLTEEETENAVDAMEGCPTITISEED